MALLSAYHTYIPPPRVAKGIQWSLEARRATIFFRRVGQRSDETDVKVFGTFSPDVNRQPIIESERSNIQRKGGTRTLRDNAPNTWDIHSKFIDTRTDFQKIINSEDYVAIIDVDAKGFNEGYEVIKLHAIPKELSWNSESTFATIKAIGRNNPHYHFTGAEDKLEFEIDWYSQGWDRSDVIAKCRKIESLSKADGYNADPHRVILKWGNGDVLFNNMYFHVLQAPYKLTQFNKAQIRNGLVESTNMLPIQAYQKVVLGRITEFNLTKANIEYVETALTFI